MKITLKDIEEQRKSIPYTNTGYLTVRKKDIIFLYDIIEELIKNKDFIDKENFLLKQGITI